MILESIGEGGGSPAARKIAESARPPEADGADGRVILAATQFVLLAGAIVFASVAIVRTLDAALDALFH